MEGEYFTGKHIGGGMKNDVGVTGVYTPLFPEKASRLKQQTLRNDNVGIYTFTHHMLTVLC